VSNRLEAVRGGRLAKRGAGVDRRGQANLVAVAVALVLLSSVLGASVAVAESVLVGATTARDAGDRHAAVTLAERLVSQSPEPYPAGTVPNRTTLTAAELETLAPVSNDSAVVVELDGRTLFERGDAGDGVTVYRGVLVGTPETRRLTVNLNETDTVTLSHRTRNVTLGLHPDSDTVIRTVRVNGRVVLHNETGLVGSATANTSVRRTTELTFETVARTNEPTPAQPEGSQSAVGGRVVVSYGVVEGEPATLAVTVDD
jgi:hypothetical protein